MTYAVYEKAAKKWNQMETICKEAGCILIFENKNQNYNLQHFNHLAINLPQVS